MEIINSKKLYDLYGESDTGLSIIQMFIKSSPDLIQQLEDAIIVDDQNLLENICHKGIGQARYIASPIIEKTLLDIQKSEFDKKSHALNTLKKLIDQLQHEFK